MLHQQRPIRSLLQLVVDAGLLTTSLARMGQFARRGVDGTYLMQLSGYLLLALLILFLRRSQLSILLMAFSLAVVLLLLCLGIFLLLFPCPLSMRQLKPRYAGGKFVWASVQLTVFFPILMSLLMLLLPVYYTSFCFY